MSEALLLSFQNNDANSIKAKSGEISLAAGEVHNITVDGIIIAAIGSDSSNTTFSALAPPINSNTANRLSFSVNYENGEFSIKSKSSHEASAEYIIFYI